MRAARPLRFKGKHRLLGLITPQSRIRSARIFGARFDLDLSDWIQRSIYFGTLERDETRIVRRYLKRCMTVLAGISVLDLDSTSQQHQAVSKRQFEPELECKALPTVPQLASFAPRGHATPENAVFPIDSADSSPSLILPRHRNSLRLAGRLSRGRWQRRDPPQRASKEPARQMALRK